MALVNGPQFPNLVSGKATKLGTWTANGQQLQFTTSVSTWIRQQIVVLQFDYNIAATGAGSFNVLASIDQNANFPILASAVALPTAVTSAIIQQSLAGSGEILWQLSLVGLPTSVTSIVVWGLVG